VVDASDPALVGATVTLAPSELAPSGRMDLTIQSTDGEEVGYTWPTHDAR
jgi:hypothetical protein